MNTESTSTSRTVVPSSSVANDEMTVSSGGAGSVPSESLVSSASQAASGLGSKGSTRSTFDIYELAIVLSHYDIGAITKIQEFPRGSRKAPKLILRTETGNYLLKRRVRGKDDAQKVAFTHTLQLHLADRQFPLPHLIGTRKDNNSLLKHQDDIYELFEYIKSTGYDQSLEATSDSGRIMALFHKLLRDFKCDYETPKGSYHAAASVTTSLKRIPHTINRLGQSTNDDNNTIEDVTKYLRDAYDEAAKRVDDLGLSEWPKQIIHSDWHSGNVLFRGSKVVAVIDFDAARLQPRMIDVANGALQFSVLGGGEDPSTWPEYLDESRFKRFIRTYDAVPDCMLSTAELQTIPWLMMEALIAEAAIPIAATGHFGKLQGVGMMEMIARKVKWLQEHAESLIKSAEG